MAAMTFTEEQAARLLTALGLADDTTDAETVVMAVEDLAKQAAEREAAAAKPSEIAAAAKRVGMELIDADTATALRADAAEGRKLAAAAKRADIERQIDDAVRTGKIAPSRRQHWVKLAAADPGMLEVLASIPAETAYPLTEQGHSIEPAGDLAEQGRWFS
jgi:hypothetical protein